MAADLRMLTVADVREPLKDVLASPPLERREEGAGMSLLILLIGVRARSAGVEVPLLAVWLLAPLVLPLRRSTPLSVPIVTGGESRWSRW
jgi:hypothetical protein